MMAKNSMQYNQKRAEFLSLKNLSPGSFFLTPLTAVKTAPTTDDGKSITLSNQCRRVTLFLMDLT